ncbi:MAG: SPOR domain-containing protein [Robiginitomaculum sp.]|nr:SPOR domain-containing protein [Robiginitomaculum sp.]
MKRRNYWHIILLMGAVFFTAPSVPAIAQSVSGAQIANRMAKAQAGDKREQFLMGLMYQRGKGVAQDYNQAAFWYGKSAAQGFALAQVSLGRLYDKGLGVEQSYEEALQWYYQAAKNGNADAMYFVGSMAYNGDGIAADPNMAMQWFQKAAYERVRAELGMPPPAPASPGQTSAVSATPAPASASTPKIAATTQGYAVQIGSFRTRKQALDYWSSLQGKAPALFAHTDAQIYKKTFESGKVFYRLNAAVFAQKSEANAQCAQYKAKGTDCIIVKY